MNRPVLIIAAGVLVVLVAIGANYVLWQQEITEEPTIATTTEPRVDKEPAPAETPAPADQPAPTTSPAPAVSPQPAEPAKPAEPQAAKPNTTTPPTAGQSAAAPEPKATEPAVRRPSFDVVRVTPQGETVMAGRAEPGKKTRILDRGKVIGEVVADPRGEWVFVPETPLPPGDNEITLQTENGDGKTVESDSAVVMVVPEQGKDIAGRPASNATQPLVMKVQREDPNTGKPIGDRQAAIVLQGPTGELPAASGTGLAVVAIDYDAQGQMNVSGRATPGSLVQIYLSNRFLGRATTNADGVWTLVPDGVVEPGIYTLRADQVDAKGQVAARVELPFARAEPLPLGPGRFVIVQPGNSLWRIARRTYGSGFAFTTIFEANAEQIADPDMIYPGQIFNLPVSQ